MASNYDRILASRQRFREQANLTQDDYAAFQQAYVQKFDAKDLAQGTRQAADELRQALQKPAGVSKPETLRKAYNNYESYMQKVRAYTKAGGQLGGGSFLQMQEEDFAKQREDFTKLLQESIQMRKGTQGALGRITAAGARVDDAALREATTANKLPGLLDEKTGLPTETAWAAWEKNRLRTAYQDAAQTAGQQQAAIAQRQKQQSDEAERLEGVKNVLWRLLDAKEPQLVRYHDAIVKQQAKLAGITDYQDAADLQRQVETRLGRLGRIQDRTAARAADKAGEVRTARALEYQLDNPSESLDANALKWERDQAAREAAQGLTLHSAANFLRANHAYAQRRYTDEKWKDISAIRNDPTLSGDYQTALEATRAAKAAEEALGYIQSDLHRDGAVTRDTAMQARHIAAQSGITLPDDDAALAGYLARLSKQEGARLQYALAGLTAAGYDEEKLQQYIKQSLNEQQMDEYTASARESAAAHPVGTSFASTAANLVGGMGYLAALPRTAANTWAAATGNYDAYIPIDENANSFRATKYAQTVREEVARQLQEKYPDGEFLGQNSAAFLYDTGMSMLDNITQVMMGMGLMGAGAMQEAASGGVAAMVRAGTAAASPVSLGVMGLTTASQKLQELTEQGVDATTAYTLATAAGSIEVLTEKIGLDEFVNGLGRQTAETTLRQLGKQLGRQMLAEGTEEAASDILNLAADALVRWDQNDFAKAIEEKRRQGYNEGDAVWACIGDQLLSTAGSFAGGALSGAGFGLGGFAMNAASNTNTALGRAAQSAAGFADLQRAAEAYGVDLGDLTQASSAQALGALRRQVLAAAEQEAKQVDAFAKQKGYKKNAADALQTAFASYRDTGANGMTAAEFAVAFDTAYQEGRLDAQYGNPGAYLRRAAQDGLTAGLPGKTIQYAYLMGTQDGAKQTAKLGNPIRAVRDAAAERRAQAATNTPKGKLRVIALDEDTATVQTADGKRVGLDKLAADSDQRKIILQAQDDGYGAQVANAMLDGYDGRMPPERYYEAYRDAMTAAWAGESLQSVLRDAGTALPAKSAKAAWETGRAIAARDAMRERIGPAGQQLLDRLAPAQAELFEKYYKAGLAGKHFDQARKEIGQADAGRNSTLRAAVRAGARDAQGGFTDGRQNSGDGQGRQGSVDPGGRGTRVAEGAEHERSGAGAAEERAAGEAAGQDTGAAQVSTKALGVPEGTDRATARVIPTEEQTPAQRAKVAEYAKAGAELVLIEGNLEIQGETGTMHARGARIGDRIIASVNDEGATWEQIARHEAKHRYFEQHPDAVQQEWERVTGYMDADSVEEWLAYYAGKYAALGDIVDIAYIQEEALCDLAAEIETGKATEKDYRALETVKERTQKNTAQAGRTKMSFSGKYWRPNLNKTEWELLHRHVEREIGDRAHTLDEATKWLYASEKGAQVFALYGIGDGTEATPLYAVGGKTAERRYKELQACMEEIKNGTDRDATTVNQWLDRVQSAKRNHRAHLPATGGRTAANRNDSVHGGPSERDRGGAFATGEEDGRSEGGTVYSVENEADAAAATETDRARKLEDLARELDAAQKAMTAEELRAIQSIGNKSVNQFTSEDIRRTNRYAQQYWKEMGAKSPFFRAWFGDWRAADQTQVLVAKEENGERGAQRNTDTGWDINISRKVFDEAEQKRARSVQSGKMYLPYIRDIVKKAVLLDTRTLKEGRAKSNNSLLMHSLYAVADNGSGPVLLKLYVEEMNNPNSASTGKRAYELQNIEYQQPGVKGSGVTPSLITQAADIRTIADLYAAVKAQDRKFSAGRAVDPVLLNEDGTPKVFYQGMGASFTAFDIGQAAAAAYGNDVMKVYLSGEKLADYDNQPREFYRLHNKREQVAYLKKRGYDGWYADMDSDGWGEVSVFSPNQIKSATENIGTFDKAERDIRYSVEDETDAQKNSTRAYSLDDKISMGLDDAARYQILKDRSLTAAKVNPRELGENSTEQLEQLAKANKSVAFRLLKKIGEEFGVFRDYKTEAFNLEFAFSKRNLLESVNKQGKRYDNYALMLTQMKAIIENAVGIETHNRRYGDEGQIKQTYVFVSAMQTSENIVPILLEVRAFNDGTKSTLRIAVSMSEIKRSRVMGHTLEDARPNQSYPTGFAVRIADLFANVNSRDVRLLKYIPDGFLNEAQRDGKQAALQEQAAYDSRKKAQRDSRKAQGDRYSAEDDAESRDLARELDDALKRNKALESVNRRLREQMKVTPPGTADPASLRRAAKQLSEEYGGALRQKDIAEALQKIWRLRSEQKRGPMLEQVDKLASELVQHYLDKDNPEAETLREIKQTVRATKIYLTPELRSDLDRDGGYQDFRRRNFGRIRLANSGLGVDQFYQELSERWPAYFPAGIWNSADQLLQIADVIQDGTTVLQRSPMEAFPDGMTYMRNKVLWELGLVQPAKPTAADKVIRQAADAANRDALLDAAAAHEQEQMDKLDAWYREKLQKVKADREDRIQKVKDRYQERAQADRDWKAEQELKRRLLWHGNRLKRMGRTATPEQQAEIERIFGDINLACQRMTGEVVIKDYIQGMSTEEIRPEGYRDKADPRRTMSVEEGFWHPEVRGDKVVDVERLKAWYEEQKRTNPDFIADRRVEDILANWEKKQINTMSPREVQQLLDVALNIENEIRTQKKLIDAEDRREVYQQVLEVIGDIESTRGRGDRNLPKVIGAVKDGGRWLVDGTLTPVRLLRRFTGYQDSDPLYRAALDLQQGELKQLDYQRRAYARFEGFTKDRKFMDYLAGKGKQKPIEITGMNERGEQVTCRITPDMRVALYLHSKNYQNLRHIQRGGIEIPDYAAYVAGRYTDAYDKATRIRLAPGTVRAIGETMTTREKNYAEEIRNYYNTMSKAEINAVSVKLKGYEVAKVGEYYPIATNRDFVVKEFDAIKYDGSLESFGFLKERKEGGTPILLADATRTLEQSIQSHAAYIGMAIPMRNFNKLRGVSILDSTEAGEVRYQKQSLMDTLRKQWGTNAVKRLETMVADLSGTKPRESGMGMLNRIRSNYAGAVLELNPSTGMKQLIAYPSAASVLGWDAMAVGLTKWQRVNVKLINRYTPLLWHRMQGFIDADLGDFAKNHGHRPRLLNWNQAGDLAVVKQIWKAAEWKVAHENPALLHDVEAWHKATAEFFNRVVLESQANYTTMERGELLRTNNVFWRSISMFKTEPFQAFNVLYDGFANVAAKRRQLAAAQQLENEEGGREKVQAAEEAYRAAKKRVAQAVPAVIASNLLEAAITFAWALFQGKDKDWRDEESGEITAASFFKKLFIQAGSNIAGIVPLGGQLSEAAQAAIFGDRYYGMETTEVSIIDDTINSLLHIRGSIANMIEAGKTEEEAERARKVRAARDDFFKTLWDESMRLSVSIGVPVGNGEKILKGIFRWAFVAAMGKSEGEYWFRYCTEKSTASGRGSADTEALFQAALDGDEASLGRMYAAMAKTKSEDSIQAAIRKRTKDAVDRGDVDLETAVGILQRLQTDKAADDLYWDVRGWQYMAQTGAESFGKYNILKDAIFSGGDAAAALQELEAHGVSREDAEGEIRSTIGQWYQGKSADGRTIDQAKAQQLLRDYGGMNAEDAEKTVAKWRCYVETGVAYDEIKTGVLNGSITEQEAAQWLQKYGGKDEKSAAETARKYAFLAENPALAGIYGDEEIEKAAGKYAKYGSGIPAERFVRYLQEIDALSGDPDGKGGYISGSRKKKVVAYIAALPLTAAQKDAMMLADYANYSLKGMPW